MDKKNLQFLMTALTLIDIIIVSVFLLILSTQSGMRDTIAGSSSDISGGVSTEVNNISELDVENAITSEPAEILKDDYQGNYNDSILDVFESKILGKWVISDSLTYEFAENNIFNGFFDSMNPDVNNYTYYLAISDLDEPYLYIYNADNSAMITYKLSLNDDNNIELCFEPANIYIELKQEEK